MPKFIVLRSENGNTLLFNTRHIESIYFNKTTGANCVNTRSGEAYSVTDTQEQIMQQIEESPNA